MPVTHGFSVLSIFLYLNYIRWISSLQPKEIWPEHWCTCEYSFSKWQGCMLSNLKWIFVAPRCGNYMVIQTCDFNDINCQAVIGECKTEKGTNLDVGSPVFLHGVWINNLWRLILSSECGVNTYCAGLLGKLEIIYVQYWIMRWVPRKCWKEWLMLNGAICAWWVN